MPRKGELVKPQRRRVALPAGQVPQQTLSSVLRRGASEVRRWLERRECHRERRGRRVYWHVDEVLVDALEEWGYLVDADS